LTLCFRGRLTGATGILPGKTAEVERNFYGTVKTVIKECQFEVGWDQILIGMVKRTCGKKIPEIFFLEKGDGSPAETDNRFVGERTQRVSA